MDYDKYQNLYQNVSGRSIVAATDDLSSTERIVVAAVADHTIFVQKVNFNIVTPHNSTLQLRATTTTADVVAEVTNPTPDGPLNWDFGPKGRSIVQGESLELANSGAGMAAVVTWSGYRRLTAASVAPVLSH